MLTILAISILLILSIIIFIPNHNVYAEYNELNENTLVNFNQLFNNTISRSNYNTITITKDNLTYYIKGYFNEWTLNLGFNEGSPSINLISGHKYYLDFNLNVLSGPTPELRIFASDSSYFNNGNEEQIINMISSKTCSIGLYVNNSINSSSNPYNFSSTPVLIDLTYMFGEGNEPNLSQCKEYFITNYPYNTGTQMPFSKNYLQGYTDGSQSVYDSLSITLNTYSIGANSQTYANNTIERGELYFDQQYSAYAFNGVIAINLLGQVDRGTNINIDFELIIPSLQGENTTIWESFPLYFAYVDSNNNLVNITGIKANYIGSLKNAYKGDFALPITTSTIYCYLQYNNVGGNLAPLSALASKSDITFKGIDIAQIVNNAYNKGASDTNSKYSPGGLLYQSIYDLGKAEGVAEGNSFLSGLDVIATTFTKVFSIFNVEILPGIPLSVFILLPLLFGLIIFVVKIAKGG